jgi:enamine deaminase RidA (YjgF/YER057c/UK114 family)
MENKYLNPNGMPPPHGYMQVVLVQQASKFIYISGQVAEDSSGNIVGIGDLKKQAGQVYANIGLALKAAGADFSNLVKINTYLTDISQLSIVRKVRDQYVNAGNPPASTTIQAVLDHPALLIEIDAIATI